MSTSDKTIIIPLRSHGANPRPARELVGRTSGPMRTRGDIVLRGAEEGSVPSSAPRTLLLSDLVEKLREELGQLPLTIVVHNWGSKSAQQFLDVLDPWLRRKGDAIWLLPIEEMKITTALPELEGVVLLNLNREQDQRIYGNLLGDVVFFPGEDEAEAAHDTRFMQPARAVVIDGKGVAAPVVAERALSAGLVTYLWNGAEFVDEFGGAGRSGPEAPAVPASAPAPDEVGHRLRDIASHLEKLILRRSIFQERLREVTGDDAGVWGEELVRQAHQHRWPRWAVECLPCYIPLEAFPDGSKRVLAWKYVIDCLPDLGGYQSVEKFCDEQIYLVHVVADVAGHVESFAQIFIEYLRALPYQSDGAFNGTIDYAMQEIERRYPEASQKVKAVREEFRQVILAKR